MKELPLSVLFSSFFFFHWLLVDVYYLLTQPSGLVWKERPDVSRLITNLPQFMAAIEAAPSYVMMKLQYIGVHDYQLPTTIYDPRLGLIFNYIVVLFYNPELALVKSSVLFFLLRLGGHDPAIRWSIHLLNIINLLLLASVFVASVFTCLPI